MTGRLYLDPGDRKDGRFDPPRPCRVLIGWRAGSGPRNVLIEYLDDGRQAVIPFPRRLLRMAAHDEHAARASSDLQEHAQHTRGGTIGQ